MATPLNIIGGFYADEARPWSQQDICNYIPFVAEQPGPISAVKAVDAPGLKPFVEIDSNGGIRGAVNVEGKLLVVAGTTLYQISNAGVAIPRGTIPGTGLVSINYNQAGIANQVLIGNGSAGYVYDTSALTLTRITDPAFPGTKAVDYLDSYLLGVEPLGRFWFHSNLADASDYNSLDRYEAETSPDRIVTLAVSNEEVVVFGQATTDFFVNTGATTGTFQSKGVSMTVGCAAAASLVKLDNTLFWLDNFGVFQRLNGYSPQPVSTRVLESAISDFDWSRCRGYTYQDKGRKIAYWTFPGGLTLGYDVTTRMWHRREAYGLPTDRLNCIVNWNRKWIGGDYVSGRLYELDWDYMLQVDQPHVRKLKTAPLKGRGGNRLNIHMFRPLFDTGGPETIAIPFPEQPDPPTISGAAPDGTEGIAYAGYTYTIGGGTGSLTVTLRSGTLPPGIELSPLGALNTDEPTTRGNFTFTIRVTDSNGLYADLTDTIAIGILMTAIGQQTTPDAANARFHIDSGDGMDWDGTAVAMGAAGLGLGFIAAGPDRWVAWSQQNCAYRLYNTTTWVAGAGDMGNSGGGHRGCYWDDAYWMAPGSSLQIRKSTDGGANFAAITGGPVSSNCVIGIDDTLISASGFTDSCHTYTVVGGWVPGGVIFTPTVSPEVDLCMATDGTHVLLGSAESTGPGCKLAQSSDKGVTWTPITLPTFATATRITCIAYKPNESGTGGIWMLGTDSGEMAYSVNRTTWQLSSDTMAYACTDIAHNEVVFTILARNAGLQGQGQVAYSADGDTLTVAPTLAGFGGLCVASQA